MLWLLDLKGVPYPVDVWCVHVSAELDNIKSTGVKVSFVMPLYIVFGGVDQFSSLAAGDAFQVFAEKWVAGDARMWFCLTTHAACRNTMRPVADSAIMASSAEGKQDEKCAFRNRVPRPWRKT